MAGEQLESVTLTQLDTQPTYFPTTGEGAPDELDSNEDFINPTASPGAVVGSTYTLGPRVPTTAKIKHVQFYGKGLDSNAAATLAGDVNLIFSDSTTDGTPVSLQGQVPTDDLDGSVEPPSALTEPNKMFGAAIAMAANSGALVLKEITHANTFTFADRQIPLWDVLGFTNNAGNPQDCGGFLNFYIVVTTAAATPAAGTIGLEVEYSV